MGVSTHKPEREAAILMDSKIKLSTLSSSTLTYWPSDPRRISDILEIAVTKRIRSEARMLQIKASLDLSSHHSPQLY